MPQADQLLIICRVLNKYISLTFEMAHGCHQCKLHPSEIPKTAIKTVYNTYEWTVIPFKLTNAVPTLVKFINVIYLLSTLGDIIMFPKDVIIYSQTEQQHLKHYNVMIDSLRKYNLMI